MLFDEGHTAALGHRAGLAGPPKACTTLNRAWRSGRPRCVLSNPDRRP